MKANNKTAVVLGDNTWVKLFDFDHSEACANTFDIHDLNTCDKVVYTNMDRYLSRKGNKSQIGFIVGHLLGVDHVGHSTSSVTDAMMEVKIREFSQYFTKVFEESQDGTMFLVTGDHGMRGDGNHGGSSVDEVQTFVFGYYKGR